MTSDRTVPFFNYPKVFAEDESALTDIFVDVGRRGAFIQQRDLEEFERRIADYVGARHVLGIANATDALHLAMRAVGIGPGDEVIFVHSYDGGHGRGGSLCRRHAGASGLRLGSFDGSSGHRRCHHAAYQGDPSNAT